MRDRIESLEDKIMSAASDDQKVAEKRKRLDRQRFWQLLIIRKQ